MTRNWMKGLPLLAVMVIIMLLGCYLPEDCPEGINLLPMYGKVKKCTQQVESDNRFLKLCDDQYNGDRKAAAKYLAKRGWDLYYQQKPDTAMMRFNQAWLLDSLNADAYWGFANLTGMQKKYEESVVLFERAIILAPSNAKLYESASFGYGNLFYVSKNWKHLDKAIYCLKKADSLDKGNARLYMQLAAAFRYYTQKDSSKKYLKLADAIDPTVIDPRLRDAITGKTK